MKLKLGTRGSDLARAQSTSIARALEARGADVELVVISTAGDRSKAPSFGAIGPQGVFVREIEQALIDRTVDLAVHSYKDLPTRSPDELEVAAVPERQDAADYLVVRRESLDSGSESLLPLARGARVGTASARRRVWIAHFRDDLEVAPLRGNVPTRIRRLEAGDYDAIVLARAGIARLESETDALVELLDGLELIRLDPERFVPAPAQGALALQCRRNDDAVRELLAPLDDPAARVAVGIERAVLARAEGGCDAAFGALCRPRAEAGLELTVMADVGGRIERAVVHGAADGLDAAAWTALSTIEGARAGRRAEVPADAKAAAETNAEAHAQTDAETDA